jgi:hypothetical protein
LSCPIGSCNKLEFAAYSDLEMHFLDYHGLKPKGFAQTLPVERWGRRRGASQDDSDNETLCGGDEQWDSRTLVNEDSDEDDWEDASDLGEGGGEDGWDDVGDTDDGVSGEQSPCEDPALGKGSTKRYATGRKLWPTRSIH